MLGDRRRRQMAGRFAGMVPNALWRCACQVDNFYATVNSGAIRDRVNDREDCVGARISVLQFGTKLMPFLVEGVFECSSGIVRR